MYDEEDDDSDDDEIAIAPEEAAPEAASEDDDEAMAERVLRLLAIKTKECDRLATAVEAAREQGIDETNPRLRQAEHELATRYAEVKEIAEIAYKLGLAGPSAADAADAAADAADGLANDRAPLSDSARAALAEVQRLEAELESCLSDLRMIESSSSARVTAHPAYKQARRAPVTPMTPPPPPR